MEIAQILNTASIYITLLFTTSAKVYTRKDEGDIHVASPFGGQREERMIQQLMREAPDKTIYYLEGDFSICSCLIFIEDYLLMIGPYRTQTLQKSELAKHRSMSDETVAEFLKFHNLIPLVAGEEIEVVARAPFISIYGNSLEATEHHIHMREFDRGGAPTLELEPEYSNMDLAATRTMHSFSLLSALCEGNYVASISIFESIMLTKRQSFSRVNAVEGLTSLRVLISMALNTMSVPANAAYPLLREFKLKARAINSKEDARKIATEVIAQACQLIRQQAGAKYSHTVRAAIDYIHSNLSYPITVSELADEVHMTDSAFTRKFRKETEFKPTEYIMRERMRQAADLLMFTNLDIRHICTQVGMMDANYFARCFKKEYGSTPTEYRKKSQRK